MADPRVERLARVLVEYSTAVAPGDVVLIDSALDAAPLIHALYRRVLEAGGHPHVRTDPIDGESEALLSIGTDDQLDWMNPSRLAEIETIDVRIAAEADSNTRSLSAIDPGRQARHARAREPLRSRFFDRAATGELRWVVTRYPTEAAAQDANMSLRDYEDFVYRAGFLDRDDPVAEWTARGETYAQLADWLGEKRELRIVGDGTDLVLGVEGRTWVPSDGRGNFPDGEVFTGPVETQVAGTIRFTYPSSRYGRRVSGVELEFRDGAVTSARADEGQGYLDEMLGLDDGARHVGEFAFGLNEAVTEFTGQTLFDEKIGGTVHLALGASYPETGGTVQSALHWDLVCDLRSGSEVYADGALVYRDGHFLDGAA